MSNRRTNQIFFVEDHSSVQTPDFHFRGVGPHKFQVVLHQSNFIGVRISFLSHLQAGVIIIIVDIVDIVDDLKLILALANRNLVN